MDWIAKQIEASERLYKIMRDDHKQRIDEYTNSYILSESLAKKLEERDKTIAELRQKLKAYELVERL